MTKTQAPVEQTTRIHYEYGRLIEGMGKPYLWLSTVNYLTPEDAKMYADIATDTLGVQHEVYMIETTVVVTRMDK